MAGCKKWEGLRHARVAKNCRESFRSLGRPTSFPVYRPAADGSYSRGHRRVKDVKAGRPAYFWALLSAPDLSQRAGEGGWKSVGKIFILAIFLDVVYQMKVHSTVYAGELVIVAFVLAILPYLVLRGPINQIFRTVGARDHKDVDIAKVSDVGRRQV